MRILVTGSDGFIGSHLCDKLIQEGHQVVGVDNHLNSVVAHECSRLVDVCRFRDLMLVFAEFKPEVVFHQAAIGSIPRSLAAPVRTLENNVNGFTNVLELCREFKVRRLIFASSSSVYGSNPHYLKKEPEWGAPLNPYALSKQMNELQATCWKGSYGLDFIALRYFNVFGPRQKQDGDYAAVVAKWLGCVKRGEPIPINGNGHQTRDFTYVDNVVHANLLAMNAPAQACNRAYNVGGGQSVALIVLLHEIKEHVERLGYRMPEIILKDARQGDVHASQADLTRAREFGYIPHIDWKTGIRLTVEAELRR